MKLCCGVMLQELWENIHRESSDNKGDEWELPQPQRPTASQIKHGGAVEMKQTFTGTLLNSTSARISPEELPGPPRLCDPLSSLITSWCLW